MTLGNWCDVVLNGSYCCTGAQVTIDIRNGECHGILTHILTIKLSLIEGNPVNTTNVVGARINQCRRQHPFTRCVQLNGNVLAKRLWWGLVLHRYGSRAGAAIPINIRLSECNGILTDISAIEIAAVKRQCFGPTGINKAATDLCRCDAAQPICIQRNRHILA